ncbi:MAG: chromate transporter [Rubritepida sp.]|nr:chromate transporter [Rubritepida sp.]
MAVVTFGGAYAVLAYVAQEAVEHYRWLTAPKMLAGPSASPRRRRAR